MAHRLLFHKRLVCLITLCVLLAMTFGSRGISQGNQTIGGFELVSETPQMKPTILYTYRATLTNTGPALAAATATVTNAGNIKIVDGTLSFGPVGSGGVVTSRDTFSFTRNPNQKVDLSKITWAISATTNHPPVANAGPDQTRQLGDTAQLDGSSSSDADGNPLTYLWSFASRPAGSLAALSDPTAIAPTFVVDRPGSYVVQLVVNDGFSNSTADMMTISTVNSAPVAQAGADQTASVTQTVSLNGGGSSDADGSTLTFAWSFVSRPAGSTAALTNPNSITPTFVVDTPGTYLVQLVVNDGFVDSAPDTVSITTQNSPPVANAGADQTGFVGTTVTLNGSGSTDVDGDPITYAWALTNVPAGSAAALNDPTAVQPTFLVDRPGTYVAQLIVHDGSGFSPADTVTITTQNSRPVANAGSDQSARTGQTVLLDGTGSSDVDGDPLAFRWSFASVPAGSAATLAGADGAGPSFTLDKFGTYTVQLIVNDGSIDSTPDTVTITTTNSTPTASAGADQIGVPVGTLVTLNGSQSSDPDNQPLTYSWALITRPPGSSATLDGATTSSPTFTPDVGGDYVAQLIVNDGFVDSGPDTVLISANSPPTSYAGPDQQVEVGATVRLDGNGSSDPEGGPIAFFWEFVSTPEGSAAALQNATTATPSFVADLEGVFVIRLTVTDTFGAVATDTLEVRSSRATVGPVVTLNPVDLTVTLGETATFTAAATGDPSPSVQWQSSTDSGVTFTNIGGATSSTLSFVTVVSDDGKKVRAVFTNIAGTGATTAANLTVIDNRPVVTVAAVDPAASEFNTDGGVFTITRAGGDISSDLVVELGVQGTATADLDFTFSANVVGTSPRTIAIPAEQLSVSITVSPIDDIVPDRGETIVLTLVPGATYAVGASAATVTIDDDDLLVTNTNDAGIGSLRQALLDANAYGGVQETIRFAIPGDGAHTIVPASPLPPITDPVVIDGTTQPGYVAYESMIEIDGTAAGSEANGLVVVVGPTRIHGLVINRFGAGGVDAGGGSGIRVVGPASFNVVVQANVIGADATGVIARPNRGDGILIDSAFATIQQNLIAFNQGAGVSLAGTPGSFVVGNGIFTNTAAGVSILSGTGHVIWANSISGNGGIGIDLGNDGVTPNDPDDADTGANDLQNFPVVTSARSVDGTTTVAGTLASTPNSDFTVQLFSSQTCDPSGYGQGSSGFVLGSTSVTTDAAGNGQFAFTIEYPLATGTFVTATATKASPPLSGTSEFSTCLEVNALINLFPTPLDVLTRDSGSLDIQLSRPAGPGDMTVNLTTSDATIATLPTTVVIPEGEMSRSVTVTTGTTAGTVTIGASASQFHASTGQVVVTLRPMALTAPGPLVGVGHTLPGTVTLTQAAPAGGVTVALTSGDTGLVSVPASVFIPQGGDSVSFLITGVAVGSTTISSSADGFESATLPIESTAIAVVTLGSGVVAPGVNASLALSIGIPAPPGGVTVTLSSSDPSIVSVVTPTVFIPEGLQIPAVNPVVHGVAIGTAQITATTPTLAPDTAPVNVTLSTGFAPNPLTIIEGQTGEITLSVSAPAPAGGLTFSTSIANTAFASVAPTAHIAAGSTSVQLVVTGVAVGSTTIRATAAGIADTTAAIVVTDAPPINLGNVTVGQNLQATLSGSLGAPAPAGNRQVTVTSQDPTKVLLATSATAAGTASITLEVGAGTIGIPTFYVQALAGAGSVQLTTTASGYAPDTSDVTLTPSGFMFAVGTSNISTTTFSTNTALNVVAARLNPADLTFAQGQEVRGGLTVNVPIVSSNTVVGLLVDTGNDQILIDHLTFNGGDSSASADFDPKEIGTTTISLSVPVGFSTPSHLRQITANVTGPPINLGNVTVGQNLQATLSGSLGAPAPAGNRQVTVTSQDPTKVLLATSATAVGTASITLDVGAGTAGIPAFYVQALAGAGTVQLETTASGYAIDTSQVTLTPSGFMFAVGTSNISTTTFSTNTALNVVAARLNPADLTFAQGQEVRGGLTVNVPIVSSNTVVGVLVDTGNDQILIDHLTFNGGDSSASVDFDPKEGGTTSISLSVPAGFSTPSHLQQITATVAAPPINLGNVTVGHNLQTTLSGSLGAPAPAGNRRVTVTSQDPTKVLLATSATAVGTASITLDVGAGTAGIPAFYVQALAGAGTVQLETTASGYATDTSQVTLTPSGFTFSSGSTNFSTTTFSPNTTLTVVAVRLNPGDLTFAQGQELRSGHPTVNVFVTSSVQTVGTIVNSPAVFEPGDSSASLQFDPAAGGNTTISIGAPAGFTTPSNLQQLTATVTAPNITASGSGLVGRDLQTSISLSLGATPPSRLGVTVTSNNPAIATITKTSTAAGDGTLIFEDVPATLPGTSIGTFFLQGRSLGTTTLTVQAPGYNDATINVTVQPSGFAFAPGTGNISTTTFSTNTTVTVVPARLDPATLNVAQVQPLRGGHPTVDVAVTSSLTTVGTIVGSPAVFDPAEPSVSVQFDPAGGGATTVSLVPPAGFTTPSNLQQITATVTAPNITVGGSGFVGRDLQTSISLSLGVAPPSRLDVTVTSNNPAIATITKTSTAAGDGTLLFEDVPATLPGTSIGTIFLQGRSLGTTTLTVQAPGYNDATINVTVQPSGFAFAPGTGNISTTPFSANTTLTVVPGRLDPATLNHLQTQALRGGHPTVNVSVTSSLSTVGTILNSPAIFDPTDASASVQFDPVGGGATTVSLVPPAGFTTPSNLQQITATVTAPNITLSGSGFVGRDLQTSISISLGVAPPSRRDVTVTSNNPAIATITTTAADEGTATVTFTNVPATLPGTSVGTFFLQGRSIGTTTLTVQAPGYNDATFNVTVQPSGFAFTPGTTNFSMTTLASDRTLTVQPFRLDPTFLTVLGAQALRGGLGPLDVSVTSSLTTVGTILGSPAIFDGGGPLSKSVQFHPVAVGSTIIAIEQPAGFTTPSNLQQITATVNATVGGVVELDRQMSITALAGRAAPSDHADALSVRVRPSAFSFRLGAIR